MAHKIRIFLALAVAICLLPAPCKGKATESIAYSGGERADTAGIAGTQKPRRHSITKADSAPALPSADYEDLWAMFADEYLQAENGEDIVPDEEELLEMHRNPVNINTATLTDLRRMPFLSGSQADSVYSLVRKARGLLSMGELQFAGGLGPRQRAYMLLFFYCDSGARGRRYNSGPYGRDSTSARKSDSPYGARRIDPYTGIKTDLSLTTGAPIEKRDGFRAHTKAQLERNPNLQYLGNRLRVALRYRGSLNNTLRWGLTSAKSEGEPMMEGKNPLLDSYSLYLMGQARGNSPIRSWVAGDFRMQMALGLIVGSSTPDANSLTLSYRPKTQGLTPHSSTSEALFLRGAGIEMELGRWTARALLSYRRIDATLRGDSISTILTNGYHRTPLEMSHRRNTRAAQGALQVGYSLRRFTLSVQAAFTRYNRPFRHPTALYRRHYYTGRNFRNYSLAYAYRHRALSLYGEAAAGKNGGRAVQNRWQYAPNYRLKFNLLHRYYSSRFLAPLGQTYHSAPMIQNEHGLLLSAAFRPRQEWLLRLWADCARLANPVYRCSHPSNRLAAQAQISYQPYRRTELYLRYRLRMRTQDDSLHRRGRRLQHSLKAQAHYPLGALIMTSAADLTFLRQPNRPWHKGWMLSQRAGATLLKRKRPAGTRSLILNAAAALFRTDSYAEALRLYEAGLLYSFSTPACYYHGFRAALAPQLALGPLSVGAKYALTHYTNRSSIGTGLRHYRGSTLQDLTLQLRLQM